MRCGWLVLLAVACGEEPSVGSIDDARLARGEGLTSTVVAYEKLDSSAQLAVEKSYETAVPDGDFAVEERNEEVSCWSSETILGCWIGDWLVSCEAVGTSRDGGYLWDCGASHKDDLPD